MQIRRSGDELLVHDGRRGGETTSLALSPPPEYAHQQEKIRRSRLALANKYQKPSILLPYRFRITYALLLLFAVQEIFFGVYARFRKTHYATLRVLSVLSWVALGVWLAAIYFKA